jgi:hypothetical protein
MNARFKLYAEPSFLEGMARLVDVYGILNEYNYSFSDEEADIRAIRSDWENVGDDIWEAIENFDKEIFHGKLQTQ